MDTHLLRRGLLDNACLELPIANDHAGAVQGLPPIHKASSDRMLVGQAVVKGFLLLTTAERPLDDPGPTQRI